MVPLDAVRRNVAVGNAALAGMTYTQWEPMGVDHVRSWACVDRGRRDEHCRKCKK